jgi:hypothetical protein
VVRVGGKNNVKWSNGRCWGERREERRRKILPSVVINNNKNQE